MEDQTFTPYLDQVIECSNLQNISCIQSWRQLLFVGHSDGLLTVLQEEKFKVGTPKLSSWRSLVVKKCGQTVLQLLTTRRDMLFCLTNEGVNMYSLPQLLLKGQAPRTAGASRFAWDDVSCQLAVAMRRRIALYSYDNFDFSHLRDVSTTDHVIAMQLSKGNLYFVTQKEEFFLAARSGTISKLARAENILLHESEVILMNEKVCTAIYESSHKRRMQLLPWKENPVSLMHDSFFMLALSTSGIEIQLLNAKAGAELIQSIRLEGFNQLCMKQNGDLYAASPIQGRVVSIERKPGHQIVEQLLKCFAFENALDAIRFFPLDQTVSKALELRVHYVYGRQLLKNHKYEEAMYNLASSDYCSPAQVLELFPDLAPKSLIIAAKGLSHTSNQSCVDYENLSEGELQKAVAAMMPYLLSYRNRIASGEIAMQCKHINEKSIEALSTLIDTAIVNGLLILPDNGALLQFLERANSVHFDFTALKLERAGRYAELVALLKSSGRHRDAMQVLQKLSVSFDDLKNPPVGAAMELRGLPGAWAAIKYLTSLTPLDFDLVATHSKWIIELDGDACIDMFVKFYPEIDPSAVLPLLSSHRASLATSYLYRILKANQHGSAYEQELAMLYLHQLLTGDNNSRSEISEELCRLILEAKTIDFDSLLRLIPSNEHLEIRAALLERLNRHEEALRILLWDLRSFTKAEVYCDRVAEKTARKWANELSLSTHYNVDHLYGNIYALFVKVVLEDASQHFSRQNWTLVSYEEDERWKSIAKVLSKKRDWIHPLSALALIPGRVPLCFCCDLIEAGLQGMYEKRRKVTVLASLYRYRCLTSVREKLQVLERSLVVSQERACSICHKRIRSLAMVYLPNNSLVHLSCFRSQ